VRMFNMETCLKIKGHLGGFCYFLSMFHLKAFLFASLLSPFHVLGITVLSLFHPDGSFERFLGPGSLECLKAFLVYR
jgi:hypothetical protein